MIIFFITVKTYRSTLQALQQQPVTQDSNDMAHTVTQGSNNNQV